MAELIRSKLQQIPSLDRTYHVDLTDKDGVSHARFEKVITIRRKADAAGKNNKRDNSNEANHAHR